jgi:hypothetical protein
LITDNDWQRARYKTIKNIEVTLRETVNWAAERSDTAAKPDFDALASHERLSGTRLWDAFSALAKEHPPSPISVALKENRWDTSSSFLLNDIRQQLGGHIANTRLKSLLKDLTWTVLLEGNISDKYRFAFAHNLFPAWIHLQDPHV